MSREDHLEEEACLWICRMDRGLSAFEKQQLITWGNQHYTHKECLFSLLLLWEDHDKKRVLETLFPPSNHNKDKLSNSVNRAVVASLCMMVLVDSIWFYPTLNENSVQQENIASSQILQTEIGERLTFTLADGSKVQLNTNSLIEVAYSPTQRQIILARGEATFAVVKDKAHPFIVTVGDASFTALGTVFNVEKMT
uniref:FecR family protein n=1 Tax=Paraglaciecola sp. TaxID=1920173 RepID=UPI0030F4ADDE